MLNKYPVNHECCHTLLSQPRIEHPTKIHITEQNGLFNGYIMRSFKKTLSRWVYRRHIGEETSKGDKHIAVLTLMIAQYTMDLPSLCRTMRLCHIVTAMVMLELAVAR